MKRCECCKRLLPPLSLFKYTYNKKTYEVCSNCRYYIEEHLDEKNPDIIVLSDRDIKKIQLRNEQKEYRIKMLDFSVLPRYFLEDLLEYIKTEEFNAFKKSYLEVREKSKLENETKDISIIQI